MGFLEDLATQLNLVGIGIYPGTSATRTIFLSEMPDAPDACIALYARPGRFRICHSSGDIRRPDLHIEARAATYAAAQAKIVAVDAALHRFGNETVGSTRFILVKAANEAMSLGKDSRNRTIMSQNFEVLIDA
jgi:hypothetical protein